MFEAEPAVGATEPDEAEAEELLRCPTCRDGSMCPIGWERAGELAWRIHCLCGNCGAWVEAVVPSRQVAALDRALDRRLGAIRAAADQPELERTERMRAEVDAVIAARRGDGVDPAGFG
jgi:hypothetical protein